MLRDPQKRAAYDRYGEAGLRGGGGAGFHHVDLSEALNIFMRDFGLGGFEELFGGGLAERRAAAHRRGRQIVHSAHAAGSRHRRGEEGRCPSCSRPCDNCRAPAPSRARACATCPSCGGAGEVRRAQRSFFGQFVTVAPCPTCKGEGTIVQSPCKKCRGEGRLRGERELAIQVPAGVATGQYMTMRGAGNAGARGGQRGDVHVVFEVAEDPRFERDAEDLYTEVLVTYPQLVLGADITVPTVTSSVALRVPPGTQSGQLFHLKSRGLPRVNANGTGDLHVRVQLWTPERLTADEERLIKSLAEVQPAAPVTAREKSFWKKMKEALGA